MSDAAETVEVKTAFFSGKVSSANLNTMFTVIGFALTCLIAWVLWTHGVDAKDSAKDIAVTLKDSNREVAATLKASNSELAATLKDLAQVAREQNCLLALPIDRRTQNAEVCKRISR